MIPIVLSEVDRACIFFGTTIIVILFVIICMLEHHIRTHATYIDDNGTEHHPLDTPIDVYNTLMKRDQYRFLRLPKLFKHLNKYGELKVGEHIMKKVGDNEYEDEVENSWNIHRFTSRDPNAGAYPNHWVITRHKTSRWHHIFKPPPFWLGFWFLLKNASSFKPALLYHHLLLFTIF